MSTIENKYKHVVVVAAVITHGPYYLLQRRNHEDAMGYMVLPGGKMEEPDPVAALQRELAEELDLLVHQNQVKPLHIDHGVTPTSVPYVMLYYRVEVTEEQKKSIRNMEPAKCFDLEWHDLWDPIPSPMWDNDRRAVEVAAVRGMGQ